MWFRTQRFESQSDPVSASLKVAGPPEPSLMGTQATATVPLPPRGLLPVSAALLVKSLSGMSPNAFISNNSASYIIPARGHLR